MPKHNCDLPSGQAMTRQPFAGPKEMVVALVVSLFPPTGWMKKEDCKGQYANSKFYMKTNYIYELSKMMMHKMIDDYMATINPINQSINQSINQPINQSTNQSFINLPPIYWCNCKGKSCPYTFVYICILPPSPELNYRLFVSCLRWDISRLWNKTP